MDEEELGPIEGPRMRARLHIRCGRRRLRQGKIAEGILALYDALEAAMLSCLADPGRREAAPFRAGEDPNDARAAYAVLVRSGLLDGSFDLPAFAGAVDEALEGRTPGCDCAALEGALEPVFVQLGVLPFDEAALPPEDPKTF
jgi:hypothetical protein